MPKNTFAISALIAGLFVSTHVTAATVDQNFVTTDNPNNNSGVGLAWDGLAQSFTVGLSGVLDSVSLNVLKLAGTTGDLTVEIRSVTGGTPDPFSGSALASATISNGDIDVFGAQPYAFSNIHVDFSSANIAVTSGDILAFALLSPFGEGFGVQTDYLGAYAGGNRFSQIGDGTAWFNNTPNADLTFSTYVDVSPVPVPAAVWLFGTALLGLIGISKRRSATW